MDKHIALNDLLNNISSDLFMTESTKSAFKNIAIKTKTADVAPVVHGKWIWKRRNRGGFQKHTGKDDAGEIHTITVDERIVVFEPYCSVCGKWNDGMHYFYCPNCGAKMDGEDRMDTKC